MPLVKPLKPDHDTETKALADFFNETLGFCPNSVLTMQHRPEIRKAFINLNKAVMSNKGACYIRFETDDNLGWQQCLWLSLLPSPRHTCYRTLWRRREKT